MKNIWSIVCSKAIVDQMTNSLSLNEVVDEMTISFVNPEDMKKPTKNVPLSLAVVNLWHDENSSEERLVDYVIEIYDPKGEQTGEFNISAKFEKGKKRLRTIANINGLKLTDEGSYNVRTSYKDKKGNMLQVAEVPIDVKFILNMRRDDTNISPNTNRVA
jgi:hypothetical protein